MINPEILVFLGRLARRLAFIVCLGGLALSACVGVAEDQNFDAGGKPRQVSMDRVVQAIYNTIASRYVDPPDFHKVTVGALGGLNKIDRDISIKEAGGRMRVLRHGQMLGDFALPAADDGRGWGRMTGEAINAAYNGSPALQQANQDKVLKAALDSALEQLDKHSRYSDPVTASDNRFGREGAGGIGITIRGEGEFIVVGTVFPDMPAGRAGVEPDDRIVAIDDQPIAGWTERQVIEKVRGPVDSDVRLSLFRTKDGSSHKFRLTRALIIPPTVEYRREGSIAYIKLSGFNQSTTTRLRKALEQARAEIGAGMTGIVLDMRGNPGGLLDQAVSVADLFLGDGVVATTRGRHPDSGQTYRSHGQLVPGSMPMVILINGRSASAAEIVAAALQDRGRAVVVGTNSYGKATVQTVVPLPNSGELTLTWSRLHAPSGYSWHEIGVMPTVCTSDLQSDDALAKQFVERTQRMAELVALWHAEKRPPAAKLDQLRKSCNPSDQVPEKDRRVAERLLQDSELYNRAISVTQQALLPR